MVSSVWAGDHRVAKSAFSVAPAAAALLREIIDAKSMTVIDDLKRNRATSYAKKWSTHKRSDSKLLGSTPDLLV